MTQATLRVVTTKPTDFPVGTIGGLWRFTLGRDGESMPFSVIETNNDSATFNDNPDGKYWGKVIRTVFGSNDTLGGHAVVEFEIGGGVLIETSDVLTVTLSAPVANT